MLNSRKIEWQRLEAAIEFNDRKRDWYLTQLLSTCNIIAFYEVII